MPRPADWLRYPAQFGAVERAEWRAVGDPAAPTGDEADQQTARTQHEFIAAARAQGMKSRASVAHVARAVNVNADHLRRVYRGESHITLELMHRIAIAVGLDVRTTFTPVETPSADDA